MEHTRESTNELTVTPTFLEHTRRVLPCFSGFSQLHRQLPSVSVVVGLKFNPNYNVS
jgi:hypothetical protein